MTNSALDVIPVPGHPGMYALRAFVEAWQRAGSPRLVSAGRLYAAQKELWDGWHARRPGFNPADNPDNESLPLAHVRFVAGDIANPTDAVRAACTAAGLIFPYSNERWHCELPNVRSYPLVRALPTTIETKDPDMARIISGPAYRAANQWVYVTPYNAFPIDQSTRAALLESGIPWCDYEHEDGFNAEIRLVYTAAKNVNAAAADAVLAEFKDRI